MAANFIDIEAQSPFQTQPAQPTGLNLQQAIGIKDPFAFGKQVENAALGREFAKLLDEGQQGMIDAANELIKEGSLSQEDLQGLDPNLPQFQSEQGQLAWYQSIEKQLEKNVAKKSTEKTVGLLEEGKDKAATLEQFESGGIDFEATVESLQDITSAETLKKFLDNKKTNAGISADKKTADMTDEELLNEITILEENDTEIAIVQGGLTGRAAKGVKAISDANKRRVININKELQRRGVQERHEANLVARQGEQTMKAKEKFAKDTKDLRARKGEIDALDETLIELGQEAGLDMTTSSDFDLPGSGTFGDKFKRLEKGKRAKLVTLIESIFAAKRHDLFGGTLTGGEKSAFDTLRGAKFLGNEDQMLESLRNIRRSIKEKLAPVTQRQADALRVLDKGLNSEKEKPAVSKTETEDEIVEEIMIGGMKVRRRSKKKKK